MSSRHRSSEHGWCVARAAVNDDITRWETLSRTTDFADGAQLAAEYGGAMRWG
jgi:hypothetical protein